MLMIQGMLVSCMVTNLEAWINLTKTDIKELEKPDITLHFRPQLETQANAS